MYAYNTDNSESKKAKGVSKVVVKEDIRLKDYKDAVFNTTRLYVEQDSIRSCKHQIYSIHQRKLALSGFDTKRYLFEDGITSLAYGHYKIPK